MTELPNVEFRQLAALTREKEFYEAKELRVISWSASIVSQIEDATRILDFIIEEVDKTNYM